MNLTIKSKVTTEREIEIELPAFYKSCTPNITDYVAILDDDTMVRVWDYKDNRTYIEIQTTEGRDNEIASFHNNHEIGNETEFFEVYNKAYASLELMPVRKFYANGMINATI